MSFAWLDPTARALDDLMNQGFDLNVILAASGEATTGELYSSVADSQATPSSGQGNGSSDADARSPTSSNSSSSSSSRPATSTFSGPLPSCHHCGVAPKSSELMFSGMLRCEHHLCGVVFHSECLFIAQTKGAAREGGSELFCPACANRLEENARVLSLHSVGVVARSSNGGGSNDSSSSGVFNNKYTATGAASGGPGSGLGNGLFIAGTIQTSSGDTKDEWSAAAASILNLDRDTSYPKAADASSSTATTKYAQTNTAGGRSGGAGARKWRGADDTSSSFLS